MSASRATQALPVRLPPAPRAAGPAGAAWLGAVSAILATVAPTVGPGPAPGTVGAAVSAAKAGVTAARASPARTAP